MRSLLSLIGCAALYGFSIGSVHSVGLASWNLLKFPGMILLTSLLCAPAYSFSIRLVSEGLSYREIHQLSLRIFRDICILLASFSPVIFFLGVTLSKPTAESLNEYPAFLGGNVALIALCGCSALWVQGRRLLRQKQLTPKQALNILLIWMGLSLVVGGQCAWYLRPFFGVASIPKPPIIEGHHPDWRGATSFYEAVYHIFDPPDMELPSSAPP